MIHFLYGIGEHDYDVVLESGQGSRGVSIFNLLC